MGYLREATDQDMELLFHWVNESTVRENAFSTECITYDEHTKWFENLLMRNNVKQYIYMREEQPIGQIRVTISGEEAEIDYSICFEKRCMGYGKEMVYLLARQVKQDFPRVKKLVAKVKPRNIASQKVFLDVGYVEKYYFYEMELDSVEGTLGVEME